MAATVFSAKDVLCPRCSGYYCFPVRLVCGHNICRICLEKFWEWKGCQECPVCGEECASRRPPINLELKIAADEYRARGSETKPDVCSHHNEEFKLFCNNDEQLVCLVCQASKTHRVHECCPVEEAAQQKKDEISTALGPLKENLQTLSKTKKEWKETKSYIQTQRLEVEAAIKEEFKRLHQFLWEEETTRLKALNQEEETKIGVMGIKIEDIEEQIKQLSSTISDAEKALRAEDLPFLHDYKQTKKRVKYNIQDPECVRDILISSAKHLGLLKFGVWKKMENMVSYVPVVLDPNTAQYNLHVSEELTCVQFSSKQVLPDNPERCTRSLCVLGATGFKSGRHTWTVGVGQGKGWHIGVARESIQRKNTVLLNPAEGFWVIGLSKEGMYRAQTSPPIRLVVKQKPERITIDLDLDRGKVTFINADDLTVMHTFKDRFTERIFPYFSPGLCEDWKNSNPLTICPVLIKKDVK
ncbi:zinc-binding protein A33-like [Cololabis saira]|uniref:zinc-binding protein A33-like n=1 Tax=Cololabis saira TaxID=129043 RepID=UPI002AD3AA65|nr:zinc-binding protein A33-like [Cololabis saira]